MNEYESWGERELIERIEELEDQQKDLEKEIVDLENDKSLLETDRKELQQKINDMYELSIDVHITDEQINNLKVNEPVTIKDIETEKETYIAVTINRNNYPIQ
jgi:predicted nuclease with TOPRIM domain